MKRGSILKLTAAMLLIIIAVVFSVKPLTDSEKGISLGLDLRGGVHLVLQAVAGPDGAEITTEDMDKAKSIIERRVNEMGLSEPVVQADLAKKRIIVDLAGVQDPDKAVETLKTTAKLTFKDPQGNVVIEGADLKDARAGQGQSGNVVHLTFTPEGTKKFAEATSRSLGQQIGIYLDDQLLQNPRVESAITNGQAEITGYSSLEEAAEYAVLLRSGALPVSLTIEEKRTVGATLGVDSLNKSIDAGIAALGFIILFMLVLYRLPGLVANISLVVFTLIVLWALKGFGAVLTLPGIAGMILSIGMTVDLNIIIYERIKEEIQLGKSLRAAVEAGFSRAFLTVFDSNITTLFAAATLFFLGTSSIKGFAITLAIGIFASLFTAITFTRMILRWIVGVNPRMSTAWFGVKPENKDSETKAKASTPAAHAATYDEVKNSIPFYFNVVKRRNIWFAISLILISVSIGSLFVRNLNLGVDFTGGTMMDVKFNQQVTQEDVTAAMDSVGLEGSVQLSDNDTTALIRTSALEGNQRNELLSALQTNVGDYDKETLKEDLVGPAIGEELTNNAFLSLAIAAVLMLIYIAFRFQFAYAVSGILALLHDVIITVGVFSLFQWEVDSTFVAAILTIFGYSINDTVVIFDRIRENEPRLKRNDSYEDMVDKSIWQMMGRSIKTALTVIISLLALLIFGGESTQGFALAMLIGCLAGAYSSIFNASQILVEIKKRITSKRGGNPSRAKA
ncbi:protein translocase subunit SecD [Desulfitobacterium sp. THU1]|uniref:protein translocase subunit SecD n=1 Tax=Desulfitobacterium sp. THU1 TaxID=3138072 RepID=UPI00311E53C6